MDLELQGKTALVTGASKGIGLGVARALAAEGANVIIVARTENRLRAAAAGIEADFDVTVTPIVCDLSESAEQRRLAETVCASPLHIVVNNAGAIPGGTIEAVDEPAWRQAWDLKVFGYVNLTRLIMPHLVAQGEGVILNVIGSAADRPRPGYIAGATGNSALVGFSKAMGAQSLRDGVRVLAVNPGLTLTDRMTDLLAQQARDRYGDESRWEEFVPDDPVPATVPEVADVVTFLVSPRASHVTGTVLTIDGGASAN